MRLTHNLHGYKSQLKLDTEKMQYLIKISDLSL